MVPKFSCSDYNDTKYIKMKKCNNMTVNKLYEFILPHDVKIYDFSRILSRASEYLFQVGNRFAQRDS